MMYSFIAVKVIYFTIGNTVNWLFFAKSNINAIIILLIFNYYNSMYLYHIFLLVCFRFWVER